jgi:RNA polymerase sigma factor (TIGR02999 family)
MAAEVARLFERWRQGDDTALNRLTPLVYDELRRIARSLMRNQVGHTLQPTALVHEAWAKLFDNAEPDFNDRAHFMAVMSRVMRQVLTDHARSANADKRWGSQQRVTLGATAEFAGEAFGELEVIDVDRALQALARENSSLAQIIEMHYFGGMTAEEVAVVVHRSSDAVRHDIRLARAWLRRELGG